MKEKTRYIIFPHMTVSILIHWFLFILCILDWSLLKQNNLENGETFNRVIKWIAVFLPIILVLSLIIFNVFCWNAWITIDSKGMRQRRWLRVITWDWDAIEEVKCRTHRSWCFANSGIYAPKFVFISAVHKRKLSIVMEKRVRKIFFEKCINDAVKQKCRELLDCCDFTYI